jgi:hypothetical protein
MNICLNFQNFKNSKSKTRRTIAVSLEFAYFNAQADVKRVLVHMFMISRLSVGYVRDRS